MDRINKKKHLNLSLRGGIIGQYKAGCSYGEIARSLNVSVKQFSHEKQLHVFERWSLLFRKPLLGDG